MAQERGAVGSGVTPSLKQHAASQRMMVTWRDRDKRMTIGGRIADRYARVDEWNEVYKL